MSDQKLVTVPVEPTPNIDLDALKRAALAATPGPWWKDGQTVKCRIVADHFSDHPVIALWKPPAVGSAIPEARLDATAALIAAANPATILELIRRLKAAEAAAPKQPEQEPIVMRRADQDVFAVAHRLALELECLLLDTKDTAIVSKWWASSHEALEQWRQCANTKQTDLPAKVDRLTVERDGLLTALKRLSFSAQTSGGTAGRDAGLVFAINEAAAAIAAVEQSADRRHV